MRLRKWGLWHKFHILSFCHFWTAYGPKSILWKFHEKIFSIFRVMTKYVMVVGGFSSDCRSLIPVKLQINCKLSIKELFNKTQKTKPQVKLMSLLPLHKVQTLLQNIYNNGRNCCVKLVTMATKYEKNAKISWIPLNFANLKWYFD